MQSKKFNGPRFSGRGLKKYDPRPGSVEFYKANLPERLRNTAINIRNGLGCSMEEAETKAALVLAWSEKPLANMNIPPPDWCPSCGFNLQHTDKPFPKADKKMTERSMV